MRNLICLVAVQFVVVCSLGAASWQDQFTRADAQLEHGLYRDAVAGYEGALALAPSQDDRAIALYRLALAEGKIGDLSQAEQRYKEAVGIFGGEGNSSKLAMTFAGLGEIYRAQNRLDEAFATERHALTILKALGMSASREAGEVLSISGEILRDQHRFKAADQTMRQVLVILQNTVGPTHTDFAVALNNLGVIASERKHWDEAEAFLTRALSIREAHFGKEHPLVASTLLSLSAVYLEERRYPEADAACRRALEMMRRFLPAGHPDLTKAELEMALIGKSLAASIVSVKELEKR